MKKNVLFIHSLFRSGSTYLFNSFRQAGDDIYCYQEPLNEFVFEALKQPETLLDIEGSGEMQRRLRHPEMERPYFAELYDTLEFWKPYASPEISYDDYFGLVAPDKTNEYFAALINGAKKQNVMIQECRTGARIGNIKSGIGGYHIYLWRNPVNQWWSFKSTEYFEVIMQVIASAKSIPPLIRKICDENTIAILPNHSFEQQLRHFEQRWVSSHNSYMLFFGLWCLNMIESMEHADMALSVDHLSRDPAYRNQAETTLSELGFTDIDFTDCNIPQSIFTRQEMAFYYQIEEEVYEYLRESGIQASVLETLKKLARQNTSILEKPKDVSDTDNEYIQSIETLRSIVLEGQTAREREGKNSNTEISILNTRVLNFLKAENETAQTLSKLKADKDQLKTSLINSETALANAQKKTAQFGNEIAKLEKLHTQAKHDNQIYKESLQSHTASLKKLSDTIAFISQQNREINSNLTLTRSKFEKEREHYEVMRLEHERLLDVLPTVKEQIRKTNANRQAEYEAREAQRQETENHLRSQIQHTDRALRETEAHLAAVLSSSSWKVTSPIRSIFNAKSHLKNLKNKILLRGLNLYRSSPAFKNSATGILNLFPKLEPRIRNFASAHPSSMIAETTTTWNLQINENSAETWLRLIEEGHQS